jgi:DNA repair photolyase
MAKQRPAPSLFPILGQPNGGVSSPPPPARGIAKLAAEAPLVDEGHRIEFHALQVRSLLNRTVSRRGLPFAWSINPYRGCEFACRYCYARYTHEYIELRRPEDFERQIFLKQNAAWLLEQELKRVRPGEEVAIGTATDPYQPIERRARITRQLLEVFARRDGLSLGIVTKSTLIESDIPLLKKIAGRNALVLHLTITTPDAKLARVLEPRAPRPDLRLRTVARLRQAGLTAGILCSPVLPGITDTRAALDAMARSAKQAGASFLSAQPLFLKPCSKPVYFDFLRTHFPHLEKMYEECYTPEGFVKEAYRERIAALVRALSQKYELGRRPREEAKPPPASAQRSFMWDTGRNPPPGSLCG